jgi:hypothetical protein
MGLHTRHTNPLHPREQFGKVLQRAGSKPARQTGTQTDRNKEGKTVRQTNRQTADKLTGRQTNRQTETDRQAKR